MIRGLFKLCNSCNQRGQVAQVWLVDHFACRCIFLPYDHQ